MIYSLEYLIAEDMTITPNKAGITNSKIVIMFARIKITNRISGIITNNAIETWPIGLNFSCGVFLFIHLNIILF